MSRERLYPDSFGTWDISEQRDKAGWMVVTLKIQGFIYEQGKDLSRVEAYKKLLEKVATPLSRSVTIARLMGGEV